MSYRNKFKKHFKHREIIKNIPNSNSYNKD